MVDFQTQNRGHRYTRICPYIERVRGKAGQEGQPIGNGDNDGIGAARVEGGRPEILGQGRTMPRWVYNTVMVMEVSGMKG